MQQRPWLKQYPLSVSHEIDPDAYPTAVSVATEAFSKFKDKVAFENMGVGITFAQLEKQVNHFAAYLQKVCGLKKGDRIAIQMPNVLQYPVVLFAALKVGLVVVNTNPLYTEREMEHQFKDSGAKAVVIMANFASKLEDILPRTQIKHIIVTEIGDMLGFPKGMIVSSVVKYVKKMVPLYNLPSAVSFKRALILGALRNLDPVPLDSGDLAFLQYTGGTTGVSKGAMLSHRNVVANMQQISAWMSPVLKEGVEVVITPLPLYHIFSLTVNCLSFMKVGGKNVLITNPRDIPAFVKELKRVPFTVITGVNTLFNGLLNNEEFRAMSFKTLKVSVGGAMAVQKAVAERWKETTGCPLTEGYGLTESSPVLSCNRIDGYEKIGTIGLPLPSTDISIRDEDGKVVANGEPGELCAKGPQVMRGYWQRPDETEKTIRDGWLYTGDIAIQTDDGYFKIVDRKKDMIIVSGFNVYPNEIEDVVASHPGVLEVAAIGVEDEKSGEAVKVFVVKKNPALTAQAVKDFCRDKLTSYKVPKFVEF
ncbi:MAG TPA: AMP-binding protein, partial [Bdellovibrionota bacterium]|nr:AMP-binding protein [Bdellovibrionota bacterium]